MPANLLIVASVHTHCVSLWLIRLRSPVFEAKQMLLLRLGAPSESVRASAALGCSRRLSPVALAYPVLAGALTMLLTDRN